MFKKLKLSVVAALAFAGLAGGLVGATIPSGNASANCNPTFLGIPSWHHNLAKNTDCSLKGPGQDQDGTKLTNYIWKIALNIVEIVLRIIGYIAVFFIIYGGFQYLISSGNADKVSGAMKTILNASIGLVIALSAVALKNLIWTIVSGTPNDYGVYEQANAMKIITEALNTVYFIAGAIAVIMIIIAGLNYTSSAGDPNKATKAKNTLLYAIIGLVVIIFAFAITAFIDATF